VCAAPMGMLAAGGPGVDMLASWAEGLGQSRAGVLSRECLRFAFYGRVSTEDWQDPVTSRARQLAQAVVLTAGQGVITAEFFDAGESRTLAWTRRPQAAALVAALADPGRGWDAIVIGEYERAFYGSQYASMAPLFEHYGVQLWMPEVGGRVDWHAEDHEETMLALGLSSKREIIRTRVRVRTAMAAQTLEQGRLLVPVDHQIKVDPLGAFLPRPLRRNVLGNLLEGNLLAVAGPQRDPAIHVTDDLPAGSAGRRTRRAPRCPPRRGRRAPSVLSRSCRSSCPTRLTNSARVRAAASHLRSADREEGERSPDEQGGARALWPARRACPGREYACTFP
jgi:Resolvase, N terminal domain